MLGKRFVKFLTAMSLVKIHVTTKNLDFCVGYLCLFSLLSSLFDLVSLDKPQKLSHGLSFKHSTHTYVVAMSLPAFPTFQIDVGTVQRISELPLDQQHGKCNKLLLPPFHPRLHRLSLCLFSLSLSLNNLSRNLPLPLSPPLPSSSSPAPEAPKAKRAKRIPMKLQAAASSAPASDKPLMRAAEAVLSADTSMVHADHDANNGDADIDANGDVDVTDEDEASAAVPDSSHHFKPSSDVVLLKQVG